MDLANTMDWNMAPADFEYALSLEPEGCFLLKDSAKRVGIATCIGYDRLGWFGNLIVKEDYRKKGAGAALVSHAVKYLQRKGVETVGLYAYPHLVGFYGKLGFVAEKDFTLMHAKCLGKMTAEGLPQVGKSEFERIAQFDAQCFGGDRKRLLKAIIQDPNNLSCYLTLNHQVSGYVAATVIGDAAWIGPLICPPKKFDTATALLKAALSDLVGKSVYSVVSKQDKALLDFFSRVGFAEEFAVSRMFLGRAAAQDCVYIAESLERG